MGRSCAASWWRGWYREACNDTHKEGFDSGRISVPAGAELERQAAVRSFDVPARLGEDGAVGSEPAHPRPLPGAAARAGKRRAVVRRDQRPKGIVLRAGAHAAVRKRARGKRRAGDLGGSHDSAQRPAAAEPPGTEEGGETGVARYQLRCALSFRTVVAQATRQVKCGRRADIKSKLRWHHVGSIFSWRGRGYVPC